MAFTPFTQAQYSQALLAFAASDPDIQANLLPSDLNTGSLERAHVESLALLLEENDQRFAIATIEAISESCYNAFGFGLLPPQAAVTSVVVSTNEAKLVDITIPSGWQVLAQSGILFQTTASGVISAGSLTSSPIPVRATTTGISGNVPAYTINSPISTIQGVDAVANPTPGIGGADTETTDARALRFAQFIKTLQRGTLDALEFAALSANVAVIAAKAIEPFLLVPVPPGIPFAGLVWLYYDDGTTTPLPIPPSGDAIWLAIRQLVDGYTDGSGNRVPGFKAAGVQVDIYKVVYSSIAVRGDIRITAIGAGRWPAIQDNLLAAAENYFSKLQISEDVSYQNLVTALTDSDVDILQVNLYIWKNGDPIPPYGAAMSGQPIVLGGATVLRGRLLEGAGPGPDLTTVNYPEWRILA